MVDFSDRHSTKRGRLDEPISFDRSYPCPVCRHGQIESLFMVEAFSCGFCRHIFTLEGTQTLRLEDNTQPLKWHWRDNRWTVLRSDLSMDSMVLIWGFGIAFVFVPTALVWLTYQVFPPLPGQHGAMFTGVWIGLVFLSHFAIVGWLTLEQFQFPLYVTAKLYWQRLWTQVLAG
jgi:hypothetical protein